MTLFDVFATTHQHDLHFKEIEKKGDKLIYFIFVMYIGSLS